MPEVYIETESLYVALYDEASPANVAGFLAHEWEAARHDARSSEAPGGFELFAFNGRLIDRARRGELLAWTLLFDGVFRAVVEVEPEAPASALTVDEGGLPTAADLVCPSGRLALSCLSRLGHPPPAVVIVEPGTYRATLRRDDAAESAHAFLEGQSAYPEGEGPDWRLRLQRLRQ